MYRTAVISHGMLSHDIFRMGLRSHDIFRNGPLDVVDGW